MTLARAELSGEINKPDKTIEQIRNERRMGSESPVRRLS